MKKILAGKITGFSGNSGVGKSTLINQLFKKEMTKEGQVSSKMKKGKNTTTSVSLYQLDTNTYIADTPGFSSFSIEEIESKHLEEYFVEFTPYRLHCEFVGCSHQKEQNCGIIQAVEERKIARQRYDHYCMLYQWLKEKEEHQW